VACATAGGFVSGVQPGRSERRLLAFAGRRWDARGCGAGLDAVYRCLGRSASIFFMPLRVMGGCVRRTPALLWRSAALASYHLLPALRVYCRQACWCMARADMARHFCMRVAHGAHLNVAACLPASAAPAVSPPHLAEDALPFCLCHLPPPAALAALLRCLSGFLNDAAGDALAQHGCGLCHPAV